MAIYAPRKSKQKDVNMKLSLKQSLEYYRDLRPNNLTSEKYRHLLLLIYWPFYGLAFLTLEQYWPHIWRFFTGSELIYQEVYCWIDAYIPLCEWFVIPYYYWFASLVGMVIFGALFDIRAFRHFMWFIILSYSATAIIYLIWPNMQMLRPSINEFPRDNLFIDIIKALYSYDTNTNVCPSIHVLGAVAVGVAGWHSEVLRGWGWKVFFAVSTFLVSISTVFMRQHSILDVIAAVALCAVCYVLVFYVICRPKKDKNAKPEVA
jgi:hypothetical protein